MQSRHYPIVYRFRNQYKKMLALPVWVRYPVGVLLIVIGGANIINPFVNGVFMITAGAGFLSTSAYKYLRTYWKEYKKRYHLPTIRLPKKLQQIKRSSSSSSS